MKIFIGSSKEAKNQMENISILLEKCSQKPEVIQWNKEGIFSTTKYTYENLIKIAEDVDGAIFIFNADDKTWYRGEEVDTIRGNVLLEYGLFTGTLGENNVVFAYNNNPQIPSDLLGKTFFNLDKGENTLKREFQLWLTEIEEKKKKYCSSDEEVICKRKFQNIFTKNDMIKKYEDFLEKAQEAYILVNDINSFLEPEGEKQLERIIDLGDNCKMLCCESNFIESYNNLEGFKQKFDLAYDKGLNKINLRFFEKDRNKNIINIKGQFIYRDGEKIIKSLIVQKDRSNVKLFKLMEFDNEYLNDMLFKEVEQSFNDAKKYEEIQDKLTNN